MAKEYLHGNIVALGPSAVAPTSTSLVIVAVQGVGFGGSASLLYWRWDGLNWSEAIRLPGNPGLAGQRPCIISPSANQLHAFAIAPTNWAAGPDLLHYASTDGGRSWAGPDDWNGNLPSGQNGMNGVAACVSSASLFHVISIGAGAVLGGGPIVHWASDGTHFGGPWSIPQSSLHTHVPAITSRAGQIDVFGIDGSTNSLLHWSAPDSSDITTDLVWSGPATMPGSGSINLDVGANGVWALVSPARTRIDVFAIDHDGTLWNWFGDGNDANWTGPFGLPGTGGGQAVLPEGIPGAAWLDATHLQVLAVGHDNSLQLWQWDGVTWSSPRAVIPAPLIAPSNSIAVVARGVHIDAFAISSFNDLIHWPGN